MSDKQTRHRDAIKAIRRAEIEASKQERKAHGQKMRTLRRTYGAQRDSDNAEIADYLARNPPKIW